MQREPVRARATLADQLSCFAFVAEGVTDAANALPLTRAERNTHRSASGDGGNQLLGFLKDRVETSEVQSGFFASADPPLLAQFFDDYMRDCLDKVGNLLVGGARELIESWLFSRDRKNPVEDHGMEMHV